MPELKSIGVVDKIGNEYLVRLKKEYIHGLKFLDQFSHIHLICITPNQKLTFINGKITNLDIKNAMINVYINNNLRVKDENCSLTLIDIKPYLPSEDNANTMESGAQNLYINTTCDESTDVFKIEYQGEIRN